MLRDREAELGLSPTEQAELEYLTTEFLEADAEFLANATQRVRAERLNIEAQNRVLKEIAKDKASLVSRLEKAIRDFKAERRTLDRKLKRVLAGTASDRTASP